MLFFSGLLLIDLTFSLSQVTPSSQYFFVRSLFARVLDSFSITSVLGVKFLAAALLVISVPSILKLESEDLTASGCDAVTRFSYQLYNNFFRHLLLRRTNLMVIAPTDFSISFVTVSIFRPKSYSNKKNYQVAFLSD